MEEDWSKLLRTMRKTLIVACLGIGGLFFWQWGRFYDNKLHLIFCDVGQGDAILVRKNSSEVLIDGGPDKKVINCLSQNMPFWDRAIEVVVLTHPEADHLTGLIDVLERYKVSYFISSPVGNSSAGFKKLKSLVEEKQIPVKNLYSGGRVAFEGLELFALWPEKSWLMAQLDSSDLAAAAYLESFAAGKAVLGVQTSTNLNDFSLVFHLKYGLFDALLTGDASQSIQDEIMTVSNIPDVEVFKVPHHGSKTGIRDEFLKKANPEMAVISVGENRWGHPTKEVIEKLTHFYQNASFAGAKSNNLETKILRTDKRGEIEIVTDGRSWVVN